MRVARSGNILFGWIPGKKKLAYLITNNTMAGKNSHSIVEVIFHNKAANWKDDKNDDFIIG